MILLLSLGGILYFIKFMYIIFLYRIVVVVEIVIKIDFNK